MSRARTIIATLLSGLVAAVVPGPTGRLLAQVMRGASGNHNLVLIFGPGCVDWFVTPGTEAAMAELEDGQPAIVGLVSDLAAKVPPLPGQARFFNPANGRNVTINADGIVRLGSPAAARLAAGVGDTIVIPTGGVVVTGKDSANVLITLTNPAPVVGTITTGSPGSMVE